MAVSDDDLGDPVRLRHRDLERIANVALRAGCILTQCGASVRVVHEGVGLIVRGLGVEATGIRLGYASLALTVQAGGNTITRMMTVGRHGVNHRLDFAVRALMVKADTGGMTVEAIDAELTRIVRDTPRHPPWLVALATGTACAAFGRLLGTDWVSVLPILAAGAAGQYLRHHLLHRGINVFVVAAVIAFAAATLGGLGAQAAGSGTVRTAMMAATLLLVPGVPATNAQTDIMDGFPTMGSARAVTVVMIMVFAATGIWFAGAVLGLPA